MLKKKLLSTNHIGSGLVFTGPMTPSHRISITKRPFTRMKSLVGGWSESINPGFLSVYANSGSCAIAVLAIAAAVAVTISFS